MASITNIDKFVSQMKYFEDADLEITEDDIHIFELKKPLTDDEIGQLRMIEETRREKLHNVLKPKTMDSAVYQSILMIIRQVAPRVKKLADTIITLSARIHLWWSVREYCVISGRS